jgi:hypothetical protein
MVNSISVKALSKVLERSFEKTQNKETYKIRTNKTRFMEKPWVVLPRNHLETQSLWWNIWADTPQKIAISNHRIKVISKCDF